MINHDNYYYRNCAMTMCKGFIVFLDNICISFIMRQQQKTANYSISFPISEFICNHHNYTLEMNLFVVHLTENVIQLLCVKSYIHISINYTDTLFMVYYSTQITHKRYKLFFSIFHSHTNMLSSIQIRATFRLSILTCFYSLCDWLL